MERSAKLSFERGDVHAEAISSIRNTASSMCDARDADDAMQSRWFEIERSSRRPGEWSGRSDQVVAITIDLSASRLLDPKGPDNGTKRIFRRA